MLASRTKSKCDAIAKAIGSDRIITDQVDADNVNELIKLFNTHKPDIVINVALPYQDLTIMDACLACGVNYLDTANYEPKIPMIRSGGLFMKNAVRKLDFPHILIIPGSGHTGRNLKRQDLLHFLAAALTRALHRHTVHMH